MGHSLNGEEHAFPGPFLLPTGWTIVVSVAIVSTAIWTRECLLLIEDSKATHWKEPRILIALQRRAATPAQISK